MPSSRTDEPRRGLSVYQLTLRIAALAAAVALSVPLLAGNWPGRHVSATSAFSFNWTASPDAPQPWVPGLVNDSDLISHIDGPTDQNGLMNAGHGPACEAQPATHQIRSLGDAAFICKSHMMTAIDGGETAYATYGSVYFTPAQLLDWSHGPASLSWKVSTQRLSSRDFWAVNLTPFDQNMVLPLASEFPAYQGQPLTGVELRMDNTSNCGSTQFGSVLRGFVISGRSSSACTRAPTRSSACPRPRPRTRSCASPRWARCRSASTAASRSRRRARRARPARPTTSGASGHPSRRARPRSCSRDSPTRWASRGGCRT